MSSVVSGGVFGSKELHGLSFPLTPMPKVVQGMTKTRKTVVAALAIRRRPACNRPSPARFYAPSHFRPLCFHAFVRERFSILKAKKENAPRPWTADFLLQNGQFCNIDRREDAGTKEFMLAAHGLSRLNRVRLSLAYRFTQSRAGNPVLFRHAIVQDSLPTAIVECTCGSAYRARLSRPELACTIDATAAAIMAKAPFGSLDQCAAFIEVQIIKHLTRTDRPRFHSTEVAKDLCYWEGLIAHGGKNVCSLGPGARKGLTFVKQERSRLGKKVTAEHLAEELEIVQKDAEQALCEFAKYQLYMLEGISTRKRYRPSDTAGGTMARAANLLNNRRSARVQRNIVQTSVHSHKRKTV